MPCAMPLFGVGLRTGCGPGADQARTRRGPGADQGAGGAWAGSGRSVGDVKRNVAVLAIVVLAAACTGGDGGNQRPLDRIDGPATVDSGFLGDNGSDGRSEQGG